MKNFNPKKEDLPKNTDYLLNQIKESASIYSYLEKNSSQLNYPQPGDYLLSLIDRKKIKKKEIINYSNLSRSSFFAILSNQRKPTRDKLLAICLTIGASLEETNNLLKYAFHNPLYPRDLRDSVIIFCINNRHNLIQTNAYLYELNIDIIN